MGIGNTPESIYDGFRNPEIDVRQRTTSSASSTDPYSSGEGGPAAPYRWNPLATPIPSFSNAQSQKQRSIPSYWARQNVLSLDGGGIRGLTELLILQEIMENIKVEEIRIDGTTSSADSPLRDDLGDNEGTNDTDAYLPCHYWDYIGGTSMGGVIAVMLGSLRCSVGQAIKNYEMIWGKMAEETHRLNRLLSVKRRKHTNSLGLGKALDEILAHQVFGSQVSKPRQVTDFRKERPNRNEGLPFLQTNLNQTKTVVLAVQIDGQKAVRRPYLFRTYSFKESIEHMNSDSLNPSAVSCASSPRSAAISINRNVQSNIEKVTIKEVCLATSASRENFKSVRIGKDRFVDGSDWMANPSMELYREVHSMHYDINSPIYCFVSIGCGIQKRRRILNPSMHDSNYQREQRKVDEVLTSRMSVGESFSYYRLEGPADFIDVKLSDWSITDNRKKIVGRITAATLTYCQTDDVKGKIQEIAKTLVKCRRQRARTAMWEKFALGVQYDCRWCTEERNLDRDVLIAHVKRDHKEQIRSYDMYDTVLDQTRVENTF